MKQDFTYTDISFADIRMLRYRLDGFDCLTLRQKMLAYCLSEAALWGRDITFDQYGRHNLRIRKTLEAVYTGYEGDRKAGDFIALEEYLRRVWFSSGIYHHYGDNKFKPGFTPEFFIAAVKSVDKKMLPTGACGSVDDLLDDIMPVMFDDEVEPVKVCKKNGVDIVAASACSFYEGVTQRDVEDFYAKAKASADDGEPLSYGLNSTVVKRGGSVCEDVWRIGGKYGAAIEKIVYWLGKAADYAENDKQRKVIGLLVEYYKTGDLRLFNEYCIEWVGEKDATVDFINGFIEVYDDPLGLKGTWEGLVEYRDEEGTCRTRAISGNAQWFEDNSPVSPCFKKKHVSGVSASAICAGMLGGGEYPATAIGINLPNADWIRSRYGSKSVTISNIISAYNHAAHGSGLDEEFAVDGETLDLLRKYGDVCDTLHTDLHECLGHGSGQLLPGTDPDALKAYGNTIEEARADLFGLYYVADRKMVELGLLPDEEAYKAGYYSFISNGLLVQLARIERGHDIEEAHMRDRALISRWCYENGRDSGVVEMVRKDGKTYVRINDYVELRKLFARLLSEIQRIKSEGDYVAARDLVERYGVKIDPVIHEEVMARYKRLGIPPYKGFINPKLTLVKDEAGNVVDVSVDYTETYDEQMLRYSKEYSVLV